MQKKVYRPRHTSEDSLTSGQAGILTQDRVCRTEYATRVEDILFLARLDVLCKAGCAVHYVQYKEAMFLFSTKTRT